MALAWYATNSFFHQTFFEAHKSSNFDASPPLASI